MASVEVRYDQVVQELEDMLRVMEDVQFNCTLLRNGILDYTTEFELARQYDNTMIEELLQSDGEKACTLVHDPQAVSANYLAPRPFDHCGHLPRAFLKEQQPP